jgi:hypothetical protein
MNDPQWEETLHAMTFVAQQLLKLPLGEFLERASRAQSIGPILDPTLWMGATNKLEAIQEVASALHAAQVRINKLRPADIQEVRHEG